MCGVVERRDRGGAWSRVRWVSIRKNGFLGSQGLSSLSTRCLHVYLKYRADPRHRGDRAGRAKQAVCARLAAARLRLLDCLQSRRARPRSGVVYGRAAPNDNQNNYKQTEYEPGAGLSRSTKVDAGAAHQPGTTCQSYTLYRSHRASCTVAHARPTVAARHASEHHNSL